MTDYRTLKEIFERGGCETSTHDLPEFKHKNVAKPARTMLVLWSKAGEHLAALYFNRHEELIEVRQ